MELGVGVAVGALPPSCEGRTEDGATFNPASLAGTGHWTVLYFYPRDNTPGCSREAQEFNQHQQEFAALGTQVIGVSADSPASHRRFRDKYQLTFPLVSDQDKQIINAFGVLNEKGSGARRTTFLIDPAGRIRHVFPKVSVAGHVEAVLAKLKELRL